MCSVIVSWFRYSRKAVPSFYEQSHERKQEQYQRDYVGKIQSFMYIYYYYYMMNWL